MARTEDKRRKHGQGVVRLRSDGRWEMKFWAPDGSQFSVYAATKKSVEEKGAPHIEALKKAKRVSKEVVTIEQLLERYLTSKKKSLTKPVRPSTFRRYEEISRMHLIPMIGKKRLWSLSTQDIEDMMEEGMKQGLSARSVIHHRAVLRAALNFAVKKEWLDRNVTDKAEVPTVHRREIDPMTWAKAKDMLGAFAGDRLEALYLMNLVYGARQSEFLGLQWKDVNFEEKSFRIQRSLQRTYVGTEVDFFPTKNDSSIRVLPLHERIVMSLQKHRENQQAERLWMGELWQGEKWNNLVFTNERGAPLAGQHVSRRFKRLLKKAGLNDMTYNECRNGTITLLAALGEQGRIAADIAGHADTATSMDIYARVASESKKTAIDKLGNALWS
jgi:integrase